MAQYTDEELTAIRAEAESLGHQKAHEESEQKREDKLIGMGYSPFTAYDLRAGTSRAGWELSRRFGWPEAVVVISLLVFVLMWFKGPWS